MMVLIKYLYNSRDVELPTSWAAWQYGYVCFSRLSEVSREPFGLHFSGEPSGAPGAARRGAAWIVKVSMLKEASKLSASLPGV